MRKRKKIPWIGSLAALWVLGFSMVTCADEVTEIIDEAKAAYLKEDYRSSLNRLDQAIHIVKDLQNRAMMSSFPEPMNGWTGVVPKDGEHNQLEQALQLGVGGGISRRYEQGGRYVQLTLINTPPQMLEIALSAMAVALSQVEGVTEFNAGGHTAALGCKPGDDCLMMLKLPENYYLLGVSSPDAASALKSYTENFNYKALVAAP